MTAVWVGYPDGESMFWYEGEPFDAGIPFPASESAGVHFEMDDIEFVLCGDLGGHAVYRRTTGDSTLYTMSWRELSKHAADGTLSFNEETYE